MAVVAAALVARRTAKKVRPWRNAAIVAVVFFLTVAFVGGAVYIDTSEDEPVAKPQTAMAGGAPAMWNLLTPETQRVMYTAAVAAEGCPQLQSNRAMWTVAVAVAIAESGADPESHNPIPPDDSYGLWQINMLGSLGPPRRVEYGIADNAELFTPRVNARAMCLVSGGGENWEPWSTYTNGAYLSHMADADQAIDDTVTNSQPAGGLGAGAEPEGPAGTMVTVPTCVADDCQLDAAWAPHLLGVLNLCRAEGFDIVIYSANRTYAEQAVLYARYLAGGGLAARPGTSNHEGGHAVDLVWTAGYSGIGPGDGAWECMNDNGPRFGVYQSPDITSRDSVHFSATGN